MKILNLYAGIGGNRQKWYGDIQVTAVEYNKDIAAVYQEFYPDDNVIVGDAHEYLLKHYKEFDFIWSSPPCQSHSNIRLCSTRRGLCDSVYPDMKLYQEILFLKYYSSKKCKWVVENVNPFYTPLIRPDVILSRHLFWSNFFISFCNFKSDVLIDKINDNSTVFGFNLKDINMPGVKYKKQVLRNLLNPELGLYVFERMLKKQITFQNSLFDFVA